VSQIVDLKALVEEKQGILPDQQRCVECCDYESNVVSQRLTCYFRLIFNGKATYARVHGRWWREALIFKHN
jgi:hypothetical protein